MAVWALSSNLYLTTLSALLLVVNIPLMEKSIKIMFGGSCSDADNYVTVTYIFFGHLKKSIKDFVSILGIELSFMP